jgi:cysteine desulfuration protein SufE
MTIDDKQNLLIEDFELYDDWAEKYEYIIDLGKELSEMPESYKTDDNKIKGCQSQVWLHAYIQDDKLYYDADSDALITKGIISMLIRVLSGHHPEEIVNANLYFIQRIGLQEHLSPTRANGLANMIKQMKLYAVSFQNNN